MASPLRTHRLMQPAWETCERLRRTFLIASLVHYAENAPSTHDREANPRETSDNLESRRRHNRTASWRPGEYVLRPPGNPLCQVFRAEQRTPAPDKVKMHRGFAPERVVVTPFSSGT